MTFSRSNGGMLRIGTEPLSTMHSYRQDGPRRPESGGVLLGRIMRPTPDLIVDQVTVPTPSDKRSRYNFWRSERPTQKAIEKAWTGSGGEQNYLGEWHTHPEDFPSPSHVDLQNWDRVARTALFEQDALVFLIVGRVVTRAWEVRKGGGSATVLPPIT